MIPMNNRSENTNNLFTPHNIVVLLLVLCSYIILFWGHTFTEIDWGLDQITYFSGSFFIFWIIISVISIILLLANIRNHFISDLLAGFLWGNRKLWGRWLLVILGMAVFFYFRFDAHLYGEGYIRVANFAQRSQPIFRWHEFGSSFIPYLFYQVISLFGMAKVASAIWAYQLLSIISGGLFLFFSIKISDLLYKDYHDKITSLFLIMLSGLTLMFFGMVENYPILLALGAIFVYLIVITIKSSDKKYLFYLWAFTLIGIVINFQSISLVPPLLYVTLKLFIKREKIGDLFGFPAALCSIILAVVVLYISAAKDLALENLILLLGGKSPEAYYWLFSRVHLIDIFNLIFLFVPLFLIFIYAILFGFKNRKKDNLFLVLSLFVLSQIIYLWIVDPKNGMIRDIPQYGFLLLGFVILGVYSLLTIMRKINLSQSIVMGLCPIALILMLPGLILHLSPLKTEESLNKYLRYNEAKYKSGLIALRDYYFEIGNMDKAHYYDQLVADKDPGALQSRLVGDLYAHGRYSESFDYANQLVERYPYNYKYRSQRANLLKYYKRFNEAEAELDTAIILSPYSVEPYHFLSELYREQKLEQKCINVLDKAISFAPNNTIILIDLTGYYYRIKLYDKVDSMAKAITEIDSLVPHAYMYQGLIADNRKQFDKATELYSKFIEINDKLPEVPIIRKRLNEIYLLQRDNNPSN